MAGLGKTCSHVAAILFHIAIANQAGYIGLSSTDVMQEWHAGTSKTVEPAQLKDINFRRPSTSEPP
jgi:hypothetical protein